MTMDDQGGQHKTGSVWKTAGVVAAIITAIGGIAAAAIAIVPDLMKSDDRPKPNSSSPMGNSSPPIVDSSPPPVSPQVKYLSELPFVESDLGAKKMSAFIDKQPFVHSIFVPVGACSKDDHAFVFNIEQDWKTFTAWVGLSDKSERRYQISFQVYLDDNPVRSEEANVRGPAKEVSIPLSSARQIKLTATWLNGGVCDDGNVSYATWGDANFSK